MEFFSRVHPAIPLILYLPVVGFMLYVAIWRQGFPVFVVVGLFLLGMLSWTLLEYLIHRYIFHYEPKTRVGKRLHYIIHGGITIIQTMQEDCYAAQCECAVAFLFYGMFLLIFGRFSSSVVRRIGVWLCLLRHAPITRRHHFPMKRGVLLWLKQYHLRHHYKMITWVTASARHCGITSSGRLVSRREVHRTL